MNEEKLHKPAFIPIYIFLKKKEVAELIKEEVKDKKYGKNSPKSFRKHVIGKKEKHGKRILLLVYYYIKDHKSKKWQKAIKERNSSN